MLKFFVISSDITFDSKMCSLLKSFRRAESMVIQNSKVNLASSRQYTYAQGYKHTTSNSYGGNASALTSSFARSFADRQDYYSSSDSSSADGEVSSFKGLSSEICFYSLEDMKKFGGIDLAAGECAEADSTTNKSVTNNTATATSSAASSVMQLSEQLRRQNELTAKLFLSIMKMLERMRQGFFSGDASGYSLTSGGGLNFASDSTLNSTYTITQSTTYYEYEHESTTFSGEGTAFTADGRQISFNVDFSMSRSFMEATNIEYVAEYPYVMTDPLVINLDSATPDISDQTFHFDLDCDGEDDEIASLGSGSGYLVYDKNNDGVINDGSEMFGARTGDGFAELSEYDSDHNGWIDEADDIYASLKVWTKDSSGNDVLTSLKDSDIGAIYLGNSRTDFTVTDDTDSTPVAQVRASGIYLHEDGTSGTIQQIDF